LVTLFTIGHSNQPLDRFLAALEAHAIELLVDVRRFPVSRRHPHFSKVRLEAALRDREIDYLHMIELGGRREPRGDSHNTRWRETAFRGYADHMETAEFSRAVDRLLEHAAERRVAMMCAELLWSHCHRGLIADYLKAHGHEVIHIVTAETTEVHPYTSAARLVNDRLSYQGLL
jgi:uncharacterized protein (DUF488 family)